MEILVAPADDAAVSRKRITGARELTAEDYTEMLREDKRRKEEEGGGVEEEEEASNNPGLSIVMKVLHPLQLLLAVH